MLILNFRCDSRILGVLVILLSVHEKCSRRNLNMFEGSKRTGAATDGDDVYCDIEIFRKRPLFND